MQAKKWFPEQLSRRALESRLGTRLGTSVTGRQDLSNVLKKRVSNSGKQTLRLLETDASGLQPDFAFLFPAQEPPVNSLLSPLVCFQDSSSSAGCVPVAEQQGTAPKVQLPLNV